MWSIEGCGSGHGAGDCWCDHLKNEDAWGEGLKEGTTVCTGL